MATSHPYISGPGNITKIINQLRKSFPSLVDSGTVKKLGLASNNESSLIYILQFIGVIDAENKKTEASQKIFNLHKDEDFSKSFAELVKKSYSALFDLHSEASWTLSVDELITFFRQNDQTGDAIGRRQANTFRTLSGLSGYLELVEPKDADKPKVKSADSVKATKVIPKKSMANQTGFQQPPPTNPKSDFGLSVRIEINLPAEGTKETYDNIFKSIRENLLNG